MCEQHGFRSGCRVDYLLTASLVDKRIQKSTQKLTRSGLPVLTPKRQNEMFRPVAAKTFPGNLDAGEVVSRTAESNVFDIRARQGCIKTLAFCVLCFRMP